MRKFFWIAVFFLGFNGMSQELNCMVNINIDQVGISNRKLFETMQNDIFE